MTVETTGTSFQLSGDGINKVFPFTNIRLFENSDLEVYLIDSLGVATLQTEGVDYNMTINTNQTSGNITFLSAPAADEDVFGIRNRPIAQPFDIPLDSDFDAEKIESIGDNSVMIIQDQQATLNRSLKVATTYTGSTELADPSGSGTTAGAAVVLNQTKDGFEYSTLNIGDIETELQDAVADATTQATNAANSATSAATSASNASTSATNAANSATSAATSASNAATSETNAANSAVQAENSAEAIGFKWAFSSTTTMADPSSGNIRLNNADPSLVTAIAIADNSNDSGNPDVSSYVLSWDDSTNSNRGTLVLKEISDPSNFVIYNITGNSTDNTGWTQLTVAYQTGAGTFTNTEDVMTTFCRAGDGGGSPYVVQVSYNEDTTSPFFTTTSNTYTTVTGQTSSITPTSASNKIKGKFELQILISVTGGSGSNADFDARIVRNVGVDDIVVWEVQSCAQIPSPAGKGGGLFSCNFTDEPVTTSSTNYTLQVRRGAGGTTVVSSDAKTSANIAVQELLEVTL